MDTLARTKKLEALGFDRPRAEGLVQMVKESIDEEVAKKADLLELKGELKLDIADMKGDIADMKVNIADMKIEIGDMKIEIGGMKGEIGGMKGEIGEIKGELVKIRSEIKSSGTEMQNKLGGLIVILWGLGLDWGKGYDLIARLIDKIFS
jgi:chromosome segregation ATPase